MHDRTATGPVVTTIDRRGRIRTINRLLPSIAAEGVEPDDVIGTSTLGTNHEVWGTSDEKSWNAVSRCLLEGIESRYTTRVTTPKGNRFSVAVVVTPTPKGAVLIAYDEHHGIPLEPREIEVLKLLADGLTHKQCATRLHISESSSKRHAENAKRKLGAKTGTHAVALAIRRGMI